MRAHVDFQYILPTVHFPTVIARETLVSLGSLRQTAGVVRKEREHARIIGVAVPLIDEERGFIKAHSGIVY